jgi:hypothetical protein
MSSSIVKPNTATDSKLALTQTDSLKVPKITSRLRSTSSAATQGFPKINQPDFEANPNRAPKPKRRESSRERRRKIRENEEAQQ